MKKNDSILMAYAIGMTCEEKRNPESHHVSIKLGLVNEEWNNYRLVHFYANEGHTRVNDSYVLSYDGKFGKSNCSTSLIHIEDGWELSHLISLILQTIDMHKAEVKEKT